MSPSLTHSPVILPKHPPTYQSHSVNRDKEIKVGLHPRLLGWRVVQHLHIDTTPAHDITPLSLETSERKLESEETALP